MIVNLHIERLVVDDLGYGAASRERLAGAVRKQLSRMLTASGLQPQLRNGAGYRSVSGGAFSLGNTDGAVTAGQAIARAVYRGIGEPVQESGKGSGGGRRP
jgi:hypothetical protein